MVNKNMVNNSVEAPKYSQRQKSDLESKADALYNEALSIKDSNIDLAITKLKEVNKIAKENLPNYSIFKLEQLVKLLDKAGKQNEAKLEKEAISEFLSKSRRKRIKDQWDSLYKYKNSIKYIEIKAGPIKNPCPYHSSFLKQKLEVNEETWQKVISTLYQDEQCKCWFSAINNTEEVADKNAKKASQNASIEEIRARIQANKEARLSNSKKELPSSLQRRIEPKLNRLSIRTTTNNLRGNLNNNLNIDKNPKTNENDNENKNTESLTKNLTASNETVAANNSTLGKLEASTFNTAKNLENNELSLNTTKEVANENAVGFNINKGLEANNPKIANLNLLQKETIDEAKEKEAKEKNTNLNTKVIIDDTLVDGENYEQLLHDIEKAKIDSENMKHNKSKRLKRFILALVIFMVIVMVYFYKNNL